MSLSRADERLIHSLRRTRVRRRERLFVAEGVRVVEDLLDAGIEPRTVVLSSALETDERGRRLARRLEAHHDARRLSPAEMKRISATESPQGVLVVATSPVHALPEVLGDDPIILVVDGVQDPGNLGTLLRTAEAFGVACAVLLPGTVDPWNPKAVRAAAGASFRLPVIETRAEVLVPWLRAGRLTLLAADAGGMPIDDLELPERVALALGNEGTGLGGAVLGEADATVAIPIRGAADSLNVTVAAGILLYCLTRRG